MHELIKEFLAESQEGIDRMERCLTELETRPRDGDLIGEIFRVVHTLKGATGFLGFTRLERLIHAAEHLLGALREGSREVEPEMITGLLRFVDRLRAILRLIELEGVEGDRRSDEEEDTSLIEMLGSLGQAPVQDQLRPENSMPAVDLTAAQEDLLPMGAGLKSQTDAEIGPRPGTAVTSPEIIAPLSATTLRVDVEVLNRMMDLVGELVLTRNGMLQGRLEASKLPELSRRLDAVTCDLRETVMQARMQPVAFLFSRFTRIARDLARTCGRRVRVEFSGHETGLDKSVLEALKDPLIHAIRNAVDHGIEAPAERLLARKPIEGVIRLKAFHQSGSVVIEVSDDGAGISRDAVTRRAVSHGFITAEQATSMSDREVLQLIFQPGFSTAKAVTHISGRGVGMDVVRANVESVGGSVELESHQGLGTTLRLRVPLTLAIIPALVVRSGGEVFALPQSALVELVYVAAEERSVAVEKMGDAEIYRLRESLLPIVWLDRLLALDGSRDLDSGSFYLAVVEADGCKYGLAIDDLMTPEEIVVKPLSEVLRQMRLFSGATVLGDGGLALILDVAALAMRARVRPVIAKPVLCLPAAEIARSEEPLYLVYEEEPQERCALPLKLVDRIETISSTEVEYAGGTAVMQYRGQLLRLVDKAKLLSREGAEAHARYTVLICRPTSAYLGARVGLLVRKVLDVGIAEALDETAPRQGARLLVIKEKVTTVDEDFSAEDLKVREVA